MVALRAAAPLARPTVLAPLAVALLAIAPQVGAQPSRTDVSLRGAVSLLAVDVPDWFGSAVTASCKDRCVTRASFTERYDINDLGTVVFQGVGTAGFLKAVEELDRPRGGPANRAPVEAVGAWVARDPARKAILHAYGADRDFTWSVARLQQRALYQTTTNEAIRTVNSVRGVTGGVASDVLPQTYFAVFTVGAPKDSTYDEEPSILNGFQKRRVTRRTLRMAGALYKLGWANGDSVRRALAPFYCGDVPEDCGGAGGPPLAARRAQRAAAFAQFTPPVTFVKSFASDLVHAAVVVDGRADFSPLAEQAIEVWPDWINDNVEALKTRSLVIGTAPIAARIGRKEGAVRGARFFVERRSQAEDGTERARTVAMVRTVSAPDNRTAAVTRDSSGRQVVVRRDSATFRQFQGRGVDRFDVLREHRRYLGGLRVGAGGGGTGLGVDLQLEGAIDPVAATHWVVEFGAFGGGTPTGSGIGFSSDSTTVVRLGVGGLKELLVGRGNVRVIPQLSGGALLLLNVATISNDKSEVQTAAWAPYVRPGLGVSFGVGPSAQVYGAAHYTLPFGATLTERYQGLATSPAWSDLTAAGAGLGLVFGIRYEP